MKTNLVQPKSNGKRLIQNIREHVELMEHNLEMAKASNWNRETKNRYFRDLALEALTMKVVIRGADSGFLYDRLTLIIIEANAAQIYLND